MSERLPRDSLIHLLNAYFGRMCDALERTGGEVLKFIGDAILGIFPVRDANPATACSSALEAVDKAQQAIRDFNAGRPDHPRIESGIALHIGDVMYGNIGGENRLDFTVIGPAVNLAARIEGLCGDLGQPLLLSADFVSASGLAARPLGVFRLKGFREPQPIYAPPAN